jgi:hypothetical protein
MAGIQIQSLPTASTLTGSELAVVSQNNVTKKTTIDDINAAPLAAASDAASDAATAQSTANGKLSTVSVDGTTITGNGTSGNPLVASVPTMYQQLSKSAFLALVAGNDLVAGKSYLVDAAYSSVVYGIDFPILVTAVSNNNISDLSWVRYVLAYYPEYNHFVKCRTDASFSFLRFYEISTNLLLDQTACQIVQSGTAGEFIQGCNIFVACGGELFKTTIDNSGYILTKNVLNISLGSANYGLLGEIDINAGTFTPNPVATTPPKEYRGYLTINGGGVTFTSLQNDVGAIVWTNPSNGVLNGTLSGAFLSSKFWGISGSLNGGGVPYFTITRRLFDSTIGVDIFKHDGTQTGTPFGTFAIHLIINN